MPANQIPRQLEYHYYTRALSEVTCLKFWENSNFVGFSCRLILQCCQKICDPTVSPTWGHGGTHPARSSIWFTWAYRDICRILTNVQLHIYWQCTYVCSMYIKRDNYMKAKIFLKTRNWWHFCWTFVLIFDVMRRNRFSHCYSSFYQM